MRYDYKISRAVSFAIETHEINQKQKRKGKDIAYITHPLTVGLILSRCGASDEVVVAGILHDTVEDSVDDHKVTIAMLQERFGKKVAELVTSVTETNRALPWSERKREALEHVASFSHEALLVKSADVISNATEIIDDHKHDGDSVFARFNAPKIDVLQNYLWVITAIIKCWPDSPLAEDLRSVANGLQDMAALHFMQNHRAIVIEYRDYSEDMPIQCPVCDWSGTPKESGLLNTDSQAALDVSCRNCDKILLVVEYASGNEVGNESEIAFIPKMKKKMDESS